MKDPWATFDAMSKQNYNAEEYWDAVGINLKTREQNNLLAGDDEPYYLYKRKNFLKLLDTLPIERKNILEVGCGPGGNLIELLKHNPEGLAGVDISTEMINVSKTLLKDKATIIKTDGVNLPFNINQFDIVFTSTVLQHVVDELVLAGLIGEMCRVSSEDVYIFERIEKKRREKSSNIGRTSNEYRSLFIANNFELDEIKFISLHWSWLVCSSIRKLFNSKGRQEGEKETSAAKFLQRLALVITKPLDKLFPVERDLAMLHFKKKK